MAIELGCTYENIYLTAKRHEMFVAVWELPRARYVPPRNEKHARRRAQIGQMIQRGHPVKAVADILGISEEAVRRVCRVCGYRGKHHTPQARHASLSKRRALAP